MLLVFLQHREASHVTQRPEKSKTRRHPNQMSNKKWVSEGRLELLLLLFISFSTYLACEHLVEEDANAPPVGREAVCLSPQHLRGDVLRGTGYGASLLGHLQHLGTAKVRQDNVAYLRHHAVLRLQVSAAYRSVKLAALVVTLE